MFAIGFASKRGKILATTFTRVPNSGATRDLTHPYGNEYSIGKETSKDLRMNSDKQEQWSGRLDMARSSVPRTVAKIHPAKKTSNRRDCLQLYGTTTNIETTHNHPHPLSLYQQSSYNPKASQQCAKTTSPCALAAICSTSSLKPAHCTRRLSDNARRAKKRWWSTRPVAIAASVKVKMRRRQETSSVMQIADDSSTRSR